LDLECPPTDTKPPQSMGVEDFFETIDKTLRISCLLKDVNSRKA